MSQQPGAPIREARRVLLIGWDGADWRMINPLLEQGRMPNLRRFTDDGVMGNVASLSPMLSPILWTSIATGKHADKHGILGFAEPDGDTGRVRPVTSTSRQCKAIWNVLSEHGQPAGVINWFASHPAEPINGFVVSDRYPHPVGPPNEPWPLVPGTVHPESLADALAALRIHPARTTPDQVRPFIPQLRDLDPVKNENLQTLRGLLASCASVHAAATYLMQAQPWRFLGIYYDAIDRFGHAFMQYHPPRRPDVNEREFQHFRDVMVECYRFHDMMLGRLMELAGDDTTIFILSDHGFHSDDLRPGGTGRIRDGRPVEWHRPYGILAARGPGIRKDERVYGASLLDITPTILAMLGLPVAEDMDGHVLAQIFEGGIEVGRVPTYETPADGETAAAPTQPEDPAVAREMMRQLEALGYVDGGDDELEGVVLDRRRNLGQVYLATNRPKRALEEFQGVLADKPDDKAAKTACALALMRLGRVDECEAIAREVSAEDPTNARADLYLGLIAFRRGDDERALEHLLKAEQADPRAPGLHVQIGTVYARRRRWPDAERAYLQALDLDPDDAEAYDGLGVVYRNLGQPARAVEHHMQSIGRLHHRPQTHVHLGLALAELGRVRWAKRAFNVALEMAPDHPVAHRCLARLERDDDPEKAAHHTARADALEQQIRDRRPRREP
jgi:tetratricopeptide (TPR) repeat protein